MEGLWGWKASIFHHFKKLDILKLKITQDLEEKIYMKTIAIQLYGFVPGNFHNAEYQSCHHKGRF
jgi:hypothetical protein